MYRRETTIHEVSAIANDPGGEEEGGRHGERCGEGLVIAGARALDVREDDARWYQTTHDTPCATEAKHRAACPDSVTTQRQGRGQRAWLLLIGSC